jgi:hypothetical protein
VRRNYTSSAVLGMCLIALRIQMLRVDAQRWGWGWEVSLEMWGHDSEGLVKVEKE